MQTFSNLSGTITEAITSIIATYPQKELVARAQKIHERYMEGEKDGNNFLHDMPDIMAYLTMRVPATYAQITSALLQIPELFPSFQPKSLLDIGSGPGTAIWAAQTVWPSITRATCIDQENQFLSISKDILRQSHLTIDVSWKKGDILSTNVSNHDLIVVANVLNELSTQEITELLKNLAAHCTGIMVIIESGTSRGFDIIQKAAATLTPQLPLLAPYINNSFVKSDDYWIHFPQRFIRPEFQRRIRQGMRQDTLTASDWEEAKYSYVAVGKIPAEKTIYARCIGPVDKQKGLIKVPLLTENGIETVRVLKRNKEAYNFAKELKWGEIVEKKEELLKE